MVAHSPAFYLVPGLGADERVFRGLQLAGEVRVLRWLPVQAPNEALPYYAARLAAGVPAHQPCWLVGVSFGGVLALEIGKLRPLAQVVLISSLASANELPWPARMARATGLHRLVPPQLLPLMPRVAQWFFSARNGAEYELLRQILRDTDTVFARWAIAQLVDWQNQVPPPTARIHGTHDRLLPAGTARSKYVLPGGYFIIVSQAAAISRILNELATDVG
ncbi:MAG TPA: alpha/beta hydrolase [Hymenobacter sp.]|jgi:pimeloyl-ACP methyl ester carboxylesterase|uniref:alpha/beta hydrolase n=1 Tax=Hymenobacter sp. TaxID=1898978 RepID=UPI002EDA48C4